MGHLRERYNARARSQNTSRKQKKRLRNEENGVVESPDSNAAILAPKSEEQKEQDRRQRLRRELLEQSRSKLTSKKKKRLDKYIDKKLKKEERVQIFERLAHSQAQVSTLLLQPSSTLGSRQLLTHHDIQAKAEDKAVRRALDGRAGGSRRRSQGVTVEDNEWSGSEELDFRLKSAARGVASPEIGRSPDSPVVIPDDDMDTDDMAIKGNPITHETGGVGSALRRNADGSVPVPSVARNQPKRQKTAFRRWERGPKSAGTADDAKSDGLFDSSDSAGDESDEDDDNSETSGSEMSDDDEDEDDTNALESDNGLGETVDEDATGRKRKRSNFKEWALQQLSTAKEYAAPPSTVAARISTQDISDSPSQIPAKVPKSSTEQRGKKRKVSELRGPMGEDMSLPVNALADQLQNSKGTNVKYVEVNRTPEFQESRSQLPILAEEQGIVETVRLNPVVVICGETGSGKTTQVPQFLYEAGFGSAGSDNPGMIGITQPRRVAAISMANRVGHELSLPSSVVSHQIRYDATTAPTTAIKFMTDGVLLRELSSDFTLSKYSIVIVDEAHERSINTDILIGVLSRVIKLREDMWKEGKDGSKPLRLIIMSATLRISDFVSNSVLFPKPPPVIKVEARQYPVTVHFNRRTSSDYIAEATKKVCKIHARLPPGGILLFLTGQNEISGVCRRLEGKYSKRALEAKKRMRSQVSGMRTLDSESAFLADMKVKRVVPALADVETEEIDLGDTHDDEEIDDGQAVHLDPEALDSDVDSDVEDLGIDSDESDVPMHVLPLYSLLPTDQQMRVLQPPPSDCRLVVISTNVAETSLTIPGIRYVVDCGRAKERCYDAATGVQTFHVNWISKASANQRAGRAGRTGPGHCYRLFSSSLFEHQFDQFAKPEILQMPIEGIVLQMKSMHINAVTNFPFPTAPDRVSLRKAERLLTHLGALRSSDTLPSIVDGTQVLDGQITDLGKAMSLFPLAPRFSKMLVSGRQHGCMPYIITMVAALSVGDPFLREEALQVVDEGKDSEDEVVDSTRLDAKEKNKLRRRAFFNSQEVHSRLGKGSSDLFRFLSVVGAYEYAGGGHSFCQEHFVRPKAMEEIHKLRGQISNIVATNFPGIDVGFVRQIPPPNDLQVKALRQLVCAAFLDQVAVRKDLVQTTSLTGKTFSSCSDVPYRALGINHDAFIHPSSVLFNSAPPDFIVFQEASQSSRLWLKNLTVVNPAWLATLGKSLCSFSKPTKNSVGNMMVIPRFGDEGWELPAMKADSM